MKNYSIFFFMVLLLTVSCGLEEVNVNPNKPREVPLSGILSGAQVSLVYGYGADFAPKASIFVQHISGIGGFAVNDDRYNLDASAFDGAWGKSYTNILIELKRLAELAELRGAPHYAGLAKIMTAVTLGTLTSAYGDVPYSQALDPSVLAPTYDSQEDIYGVIQNLISEGMTLLDEPSAISPGADDLIY